MPLAREQPYAFGVAVIFRPLDRLIDPPHDAAHFFRLPLPHRCARAGEGGFDRFKGVFGAYRIAIH
ncbi:hypothetical protein ASE65_10590 [Sphingomonas sp. Leaf16]|nr:hypothetical protein ASE65_10590 [Sphingomonas sp. Leaf16]KQN11058.1 hypothetical protein ASE81_11575 [Sphingomonas sp. Leaf29]KQN18359.1 hypothetical protein ASE83_11510 [Sphingomonas sp. Leaf32]